MKGNGRTWVGGVGVAADCEKKLYIKMGPLTLLVLFLKLLPGLMPKTHSIQPK